MKLTNLINEEHPYDLPPDDKALEAIRKYVRENLRNWFKKENGNALIHKETLQEIVVQCLKVKRHNDVCLQLKRVHLQRNNEQQHQEKKLEVKNNLLKIQKQQK